MFPLLLLACQTGIPIPDGVIQDIARDVAKVGHPHGTFVGARLVGASYSSDSSTGHLDIAVDYTVKQPHVMTVRFDVASIEPCKVKTQVLSDTGPSPVLLDNAIASPLVGKHVCAALTEAN